MTPAEPTAPRGVAAVANTQGAGPRRALALPADGVVHVWTVAQVASSERALQALAGLPPDERAQAARLRLPQARAAFALRRAALRQILAGYLGTAARDLVFTLNGFGKPALPSAPGAAALAFNASHSGALALVAVARSGLIGIDVEQCRSLPDAMNIAAQFFSSAEAAALQALPPAQQQAGFFNAWTRKEALVKAHGEGLSMPLNAFDVTLRPGEPAAVLRWDAPPTGVHHWQLKHLEPADGWVGALATDFVVSRLCCRPWPV